MLPPTQRALWPRLDQIPEDFVLYGGTAVALRLGHRSSVDFDLFSERAFATPDLVRRISLLRLPGGKVQQNVQNTFSIGLPLPEGPVNLSFLGSIDFGQIRAPDRCSDNGLKIASGEDLLALKLATIHSRIEAKDYIDIWALLKSGHSLPVALGHLEALHPRTTNWMITLQTLVYFKGGDLDALSPEIKRDLEAAVREVREVPTFTGRKTPIGWLPTAES